MHSQPSARKRLLKRDLKHPMSFSGVVLAGSTPVNLTTATIDTSAPLASPASHKVLDSIFSVQDYTYTQRKPIPRWKKIATWAVMLMPVYSILIFIGGFFYFLPYEMKGIGINPSLPTHILATAGTISVADQEGIFFQDSADGKGLLHLTLQYNSRSLQPPQNAQMIFSPTQLKYVIVRQAQVDLPNTYKIVMVSSNGPDQPINAMVQRVHYPGIAEMAISMPNGQPWAAGSYMITVPEAGLDSATYYSFFTVK